MPSSPCASHTSTHYSRPQISVVIPVFNRPGMARRAIQSACAQDVGMRKLEVIVVDDGSRVPFVYPDGDARVRILRLTRNCGAPAARNAGVRAASGDFVAFLDSDDVWLPGRLAREIALLEAHACASEMCTVLAAAFYCPDRRTGRLELRVPKPAAGIDLFASGCWFSPGSTLVAPRQILVSCGPFDETLGRLEDYEWFLRFAQAGGQLVIDPEPAAVVAPSGAARTTTVDASVDKIRNRYGPGARSPLPASAYKRMQAYLALERGAACLSERRYMSAAMHIAWSMALRPRLQGSLEKFWDIRKKVPRDITAIYAAMQRARADDEGN